MYSHYNRLIEAILMSTYNTPLSAQKRNSPEIILNTIMSKAIGLFSEGLKNELEIAIVQGVSKKRGPFLKML